MNTGSGSLLTKEQLLALVQSGNRLNSKLELKQVLQSMLKIACNLSGSTAGSVILHDDQYDDLYFAAAIGPAKDDLSSIRIPPGYGKAGKVFSTRKPMIDNDLAINKSLQRYTRLAGYTHISKLGSNWLQFDFERSSIHQERLHATTPPAMSVQALRRLTARSRRREASRARITRQSDNAGSRASIKGRVL